MAVISFRRESAPAPGAQLHFRGVRTFWGGTEVRLTYGELRLVQALTARHGDFASYREIYDAFTGRPGLVVGDHQANLRSIVKRIRNKFRAVDPDFTEIENFTGYGYRWRPGSITEV